MPRNKDEIYLTPNEDGSVGPRKGKEIRKALKAIAGKRVIMTIERAYKKRSTLQNAYYWGCIVPHEIDAFEEVWGERFAIDQIHTFNKNTFFSTEHVIEDETNDFSGEIIRIPGTTTGHTTVEFEEKLLEIRKYFIDKFGYYIPEPNEQLELPIDPEGPANNAKM